MLHRYTLVEQMDPPPPPPPHLGQRCGLGRCGGSRFMVLASPGPPHFCFSLQGTLQGYSAHRADAQEAEGLVRSHTLLTYSPYGVHLNRAHGCIGSVCLTPLPSQSTRPSFESRCDKEIKLKLSGNEVKYAARPCNIKEFV